MWRDTSDAVRIFGLDARACFPMLAFILYWSWPTLYIAVGGTVFFAVLSWAGLSVGAFLRVLRRKLVGSVRPAVPSWKRRRYA